MGRKRKTNKHLPERVYWHDGAYRYRFPNNGRWVRLGDDLPSMYRGLAELLDLPQEQGCQTFKDLKNRYLKEVAVLKSESSYKNNLRESQNLEVFFGDMMLVDIEPVVIYQYMDLRGTKGKIAANRELALLSHMMQYAIRWGSVKENPCRDIQRFPENKRSRNITEAEFEAVLSIAKYPIKHLMQLAYLMGLRPTEALYLKWENVTSEGIFVELNKTKHNAGSSKKKLVAWSDALKEVIKDIKSCHSIFMRDKEFVIVSSSGEAYKTSSLNTFFKRVMNQSIEKELLTEPFQFRDIRHKAATDMERKHGREAARILLGHTTQTMTDRYIDGHSVTLAVK